MKEGGHIDPDLYDLFVSEKVHLRYAREFLPHHQFDDMIVEEPALTIR